MIQPVFHDSIEDLKKRLRLNDVPASKNIIAIMEEALLNARAFFFRRLGSNRVSEIKAIGAMKDAPTTDNEFLRLIAGLCELKYIKWYLAIHCKVLVQDAGDAAQQTWNEEGILRESSPFELNSFIKKLSDQIEDDIDYLRGDETPGQENLLRATDLGPDVTPPRPFDSIQLTEW